MNKIIEKLLKLTYPEVNIESLMEVISNTPNPEIATEIMCGLYVHPEIKYKRVKSKNSEGILTFVDYDKWNDRVNYKYMQKEQKSAYFPKTVKKEDVTLENFDQLKVSYKEGETHTIYVPTGKEEERKSYVSLNTWNSYPYEPTEREIKQQEQENIFSN